LSILFQKIKDNLLAVIPIVIIVMVLNFTITPIENHMLFNFFIGSLMIILGLSFFLVGVDIGITPLGSLTGSSIARKNKLWIILLSGLILGFFISIAEPGLLVLANQIDFVTSGVISSLSILIVVSVGIAVMISVGFLRIIFNLPLYKLLILLYLIIFILSLFTTPEFLAIAFDTSGATTGILAVPFILALSVGISKLKKDSKASEKDSFGLIAIASSGAIIAVMILNLFSKSINFSEEIVSNSSENISSVNSFFDLIPSILKESLFSLLPLLIMLLILQIFSFKLDIRAFRKIIFGFLYSFLGLFLFLVGVNGGFMDVGSFLGEQLSSYDNNFVVIIIGFILGIFTIIAEPAVYVLTHQIEEITSGYVKRKAVLTALSIGVGFAVALSVIRITIPGIQLWHYLLPGYVVSLIMSIFAPKLFVGIAFDAGGVATGPMTATFILAFINGIASGNENANVLIDGFGMIALVALAPIISLQILGFIFKVKSEKIGVKNNE